MKKRVFSIIFLMLLSLIFFTNKVSANSEYYYTYETIDLSHGVESKAYKVNLNMIGLATITIEEFSTSYNGSFQAPLVIVEEGSPVLENTSFYINPFGEKDGMTFNAEDYENVFGYGIGMQIRFYEDNTISVSLNKIGDITISIEIGEKPSENNGSADLNFQHSLKLFWTDQYSEYDYYLATDEFNGMPHGIPAIADYSLTAIVGNIVAFNEVGAIYPGHSEFYAYYVFMPDIEELHFYDYKLKLKQSIPYDELVSVTTDISPGSYNDGFNDGYNHGYNDSTTNNHNKIKNLYFETYENKVNYWKSLSNEYSSINVDYKVVFNNNNYIYPKNDSYINYNYTTGKISAFYTYLHDAYSIYDEILAENIYENEVIINIPQYISFEIWIDNLAQTIFKYDHTEYEHTRLSSPVKITLSESDIPGFPLSYLIELDGVVLKDGNISGSYDSLEFQFFEPEILTQIFYVEETGVYLEHLKGESIVPLFNGEQENKIFIGWKIFEEDEIFDFSEKLLNEYSFLPVYESTLPPLNEDDYDFLIVDTSMIDHNKEYDVSQLGYDFDKEFMENITFYIWDNNAEEWKLSVQNGVIIDGKPWMDFGDENLITYFFEGIGINVNASAMPSKNIILLNESYITTGFKIAIPKTTEVESFEINFYLENELYDQVNVLPGEDVVLPATPETTEENKVFLGWYYDEEFTVPFKTTDPIEEDLTLYGKFGSGGSGGTETPPEETPGTEFKLEKKYVIIAAIVFIGIGLALIIRKRK